METAIFGNQKSTVLGFLDDFEVKNVEIKVDNYEISSENHQPIN
jgi:hypothetical protein